MKTKNPDAAEKTGDRIARDYPCRDPWTGVLDLVATNGQADAIARAIRAAEKRGALAERERIERYIKERRISSPNLVVVTTCADILTDIDHGARPARKATKTAGGKR